MKKLSSLLKESQYLDYRRLNIGEDGLGNTEMTPEEKLEFLEAVASYRKIGEAIYHNGNMIEAYEKIKKIVETAQTLTLKETTDWFDKVTVNRHMKSMNESFKVFSNTIKEVAPLQQRLESTYDEIGEVLSKYYEIREGNTFGAERAKAIAGGESSFNVSGKKFKVTGVDAADKQNAKQFVGENMSNMKLKSMLPINEANDKLMKVGATMMVGGDGSGMVKPVKMKLVSIDYLPKEDKYSYKFQGGGRTQYYTDDVLAKKLKESVNEGFVSIALGVAGGLLLLKLLKLVVRKALGAIGSNVSLSKDKLLIVVDSMVKHAVLKGGSSLNMVDLAVLQDMLKKDINSGKITTINQIEKVVTGASKNKNESVNEAKVIVYNEKTGERYEVLSGKGKGDLIIAMKALQSAAPSHMKYSIKENQSVNETKFYAFWGNKKHEIEANDLWDAKQKAITMLKVPKSKVGLLAVVNAKAHDGGSFMYQLNGGLSSELPKASIPAAIEQRLALALQKIESGKLNFNQKIQLLAKVVDALGVDKTQLGTLTSKIKSKMEEGNEFGAERARAIAAGKDTFTVDGKTYKVTDVDAADKKNAGEFVGESMRLSTFLKKKSR